MEILTECNLSVLMYEFLNGKTVVFPTETSYGLGCDATNQSAVNKIFAIKARDESKPLLVVVPSVAEAKKYLVWNDTLEKLAKDHWPGPLTVVGEATDSNLAKGVISKKNTVAVRVTNFPFLRSLTKTIGRPIVATSANLAGGKECYSADEVSEVFKDRDVRPDLVLNGGNLEKHLPSTVVSVVNNKLEILRQGELKIDL